jgi:predicted metal-binding membrane protein
MNRVQKAVVISLVATSAIAWVASIDQPDMMVAMTTYNPLSISLFAASWTAGMAAMMFPAITPMVLMYSRLVVNTKNTGENQSSITIQEEKEHRQQRDKSASSLPSLRVIIFVGSYLLVWAVTGISLLLAWSLVMNGTIMTSGNPVVIQSLYGALLVIAGAYQFTPLKRICIGYCESPMSFFMRRWRDGTAGALNMGVYHGIYCLGCCWAYFLLMVALGWMSVLWMGLFAEIIFGEKIWSRGIWVARAAGIGLAITGVLIAAGMIPSIVSSATSMTGHEDDTGGDDMTMMMRQNDNASINNNNDMVMSDSSPGASTNTPEDSVASSGAGDESDSMTSNSNDHAAEFTDNDNGNEQSPMEMD